MHSMASGFAFFTIIERRASCAANPESFRDKFFGNGSSPLASRWFGTSAENFSNQKCEICVSTSPLRGMPLGMMTSKAEMRSLATSRKLSPRSKTSRTLPERTFLMPGRSNWRIGALFITQKIKSAGKSSKPKMGQAPSIRLKPPPHLSRFAGVSLVSHGRDQSQGVPRQMATRKGLRARPSLFERFVRAERLVGQAGTVAEIRLRGFRPRKTDGHGPLNSSGGNFHGVAGNLRFGRNKFSVRAGNREPRQRLAVLADESAVRMIKFQHGLVAGNFHFAEDRAGADDIFCRKFYPAPAARGDGRRSPCRADGCRRGCPRDRWSRPCRCF